MEPSSSPVLLVDDEHDHVELYQLALELSGLSVVAAYSGRDGLELARTVGPAAVVLDLRLPDMSGWDVLAALKSDPQTRPVPVVLLTAAATSTLLADAMKAGCAACLTKPCFPDLLTRTVRGVIDGHGPTA